MSDIFTQSAQQNRAEGELTLRQMFEEMQILDEKMRQDQAVIDRNLNEIQELKVKTRAILGLMGVKI